MPQAEANQRDPSRLPPAFAAFTAEEWDRSEVDPAMELATEAVPRVAQASGGDSAVAEQGYS